LQGWDEYLLEAKATSTAMAHAVENFHLDMLARFLQYCSAGFMSLGNFLTVAEKFESTRFRLNVFKELCMISGMHGGPPSIVSNPLTCEQSP